VPGTWPETLVLPSRLEDIDTARRWAACLAQEAGADEDVVAALELALTEALSNIVRHAYDGDPGQEIDLALVITETWVEVSVRDRGRPFDEAAYRPPDPEHPGEGGYGVQLISDVMDHVNRTSLDGGGTLLEMRKYLGGVRGG
jgi:serine/threonine-protein kinase RsbW